jgi:beta-lactamase regulating signal transducer with metallopeptidase domain
MIAGLTNHLWQSTLFAGVAGLLALVLRNNGAQTRYGLWLAASLKFLVPFSLLIALGGSLTWRSAPVAAPPGVTFAIEHVAEPFPVVPGVAPAARTSGMNPAAIVLVIWLCGSAAVFFRWRRYVQLWAPCRSP